MAKWQKQWETLMLQALEEKGIEYEKTSLSIHSNLKPYRDYDWDGVITAGQIVDVIYPSRKGGSLKVKGTNSNDLPVELGKVSFYNEEKKYYRAIIGQLYLKTLDYANGDSRECLEFEQPIILTTSERLSPSMFKSKALDVKSKPSKSKGTVNCVIGIFFLIVMIGIAVIAC